MSTIDTGLTLLKSAAGRVSAANGWMGNAFKGWMPTGLYARALLIMMREVLERRFKRLINPPEDASGKAKDDDFPQWPDLVIIDGGRGQLNAVREIFANLGLTQVSLMSVAKGPDRDAGRETLFMPIKLAADREHYLEGFRRAGLK